MSYKLRENIEIVKLNESHQYQLSLFDCVNSDEDLNKYKIEDGIFKSKHIKKS